MQLRSLPSFLLAMIFLGACTHTPRTFERHLQAKNCDEALNTVPENDPSIRLLKHAESSARTAISYGYIGANYSAEILWDTVAGGLTLVALCSPGILVSATLAAQSGNSQAVGSPNKYCFPLSHLNAVLAPPLGRKAIQSTAELRCPDLSSLIHSLRSVSACFEEREDRASLLQAERSLEVVQESSGFYSCFNSTEKMALESDLARIRNKLALLQM